MKLVAVGYNHVFDRTVLQLDYEVISRNINHLSRTRKDHAALLILESIVGEDSYILLSRLRGTSPGARIPPPRDRVYQVNPAHLTVGPSRSWEPYVLTDRKSSGRIELAHSVRFPLSDTAENINAFEEPQNQ